MKNLATRLSRYDSVLHKMWIGPECYTRAHTHEEDRVGRTPGADSPTRT